jgi:hypothetical protein
MLNHDKRSQVKHLMNAVLKHFWMSGEWGKPIILKWKLLRDVSVGWKEFKPPTWEAFTP